MQKVDIAMRVVGVSDPRTLDQLRRMARKGCADFYDVRLHTYLIEVGTVDTGIITLIAPSEEVQSLMLDALGVGDLCSPLAEGGRS